MESTHKFGMESTHKFSMESTHKFGISSVYCNGAAQSNLPVTMANFNSPMALVIWISRGQAIVQL